MEACDPAVPGLKRLAAAAPQEPLSVVGPPAKKTKKVIVPDEDKKVHEEFWASDETELKLRVKGD